MLSGLLVIMEMKNVKTRPRFTNEKGFIALTHIFRRLERSFIKMLI